MSLAKTVVNKILEGADVRKTIAEVNVPQEISDEYIKHYSGELGEFDYDTREFELDGYLHYIGTEPDGSKIKIPDGVKKCNGMFADCKFLIKAPAIPDGVKDCTVMFKGCTSLIIAPEIPDSVKDCRFMFYNCESLTTPPVIPNGVENCDSMFSGCESLKKAPIIPNSVKDCDMMFLGCHLLTKASEIPNGVKFCSYMFADCVSLTKAPVIPDSVIKNCKDTMFDGCSKEVQVAGYWNMFHRGQSYYDQNQ